MELFVTILIGILLPIVLYLLSPEPLRRRIRRLSGQFLRRHPAEAVLPDIGIFAGRVEILTDELLSHPADATRTRQFYEGSPLDWDIIAAHADIERDQHGHVLALLRQPARAPARPLRFVCIYGESGSGKSTLARSVAAELHKHGALVLRVKDSEDPEPWYLITQFCRTVRRPFYILADDLFRTQEVRRALAELSAWLPVTVLVTSQTNEYRPGRLKGEVIAVPLGPPSLEEKKRVLCRLGRGPSDLSPEQFSRMQAANEFLVLMVELTSGKDFQAIVEESLRNLWRLHEPIYRVYEYLCFSYAHGLAIPGSILERLGPLGAYSDLPSRDGAQGLVFYDESRPHCLRPGHPRRAEIAMRLFERHRSAAAVLEELVKAVDVSEPQERRYIAHLLRSLAYSRAEVVGEALPRIEQKVAACVRASSRISELTIWRAFYVGVGLSEEAERCVDAALALEPVSSVDCNLAVNLYRERGRERDALPVLHRWIHSHGEGGGARPAYLRLIGRYGTVGDQERAISDTSAWLAAHPDDKNVRTAYIGLVERKGTAEQTERVLQETSAWLAAHPDDNNVRRTYLGLVERKGTAEQTERVLQEIPAWLRTHPDVSDMWMRFISYLCTLERFDDARALAEEAVTIHSTNSNLVGHYLTLMRDRLDEARTRELFKSLMDNYPRDQVIKNQWARWLHARSYWDEAEGVFKKFIREHPRSFLPWYGYGRLLLDMERYREAAYQFRRVLAIHRGHAMAHDGLARALDGLARREEDVGNHSEAAKLSTSAEREFRSAIYWADVADDRQAVFFTHLGWFYANRQRWTDALASFEQAASEAPEYFENYWGKGHVLVAIEQWSEALVALRTALEKAGDALDPPASDKIPQLIERWEVALSNDDSGIEDAV